MKSLGIALLVIGSLIINAHADNAKIQRCMMKMEDGLRLIQKGYLYDNMATVRLGIAEIRSANDKFSNEEMKNCLPEGKKHLVNISYNTSLGIKNALLKMERLLQENEISKAYDSVPVLLQNCIACHSLVRSW